MRYNIEEDSFRTIVCLTIFHVFFAINQTFARSQKSSFIPSTSISHPSAIHKRAIFSIDLNLAPPADQSISSQEANVKGKNAEPNENSSAAKTGDQSFHQTLAKESGSKSKRVVLVSCRMPSKQLISALCFY